jgi:hypothetical protein
MKDFDQKFKLRPLPVAKEVSKEQPGVNSATDTSLEDTIRMCVDMESMLAEKIKDYAYWEGLTQQEIIMQALKIFMEDKSVKSRPEAVRKRARLGRKKKS